MHIRSQSLLLLTHFIHFFRLHESLSCFDAAVVQHLGCFTTEIPLEQVSKFVVVFLECDAIQTSTTWAISPSDLMVSHDETTMSRVSFARLPGPSHDCALMRTPKWWLFSSCGNRWWRVATIRILICQRMFVDAD